MNERIRELAIEAGMIVGEANGFDMARLMPREVKFAELIVRECVDVCKSRVGNSDYNTGRMHCVSDLKEHFGVEE